MKQEILQALAEWIIRIAKKEIATSAEVAALPEVAKVVLEYYSGCFVDTSDS